MSGREPRSRFAGMRRQTSDPETSRSRERDSSRESSNQREVRCGCQYFQTDSLLPERQSLVGTRPPSRQEVCADHSSSRADMNGDHEYEPINPMASQRSPHPVMKVTDTEATPKKKKGLSSRITYIDNDPNFIHIPLHGSDEDVPETYLQIPTDDKIVVSQDVDADADIEDAQEEDKEFDDEDLSAQEIQNRMEERFFAPSPTTESRTDCEMNTSQIDSSALEDLPLKREARKAGSDSKGFQQKIKSQAGRLRTKFKNFSKPKISLPDRPKFNLPERPKFKMPERPKINLPDRPKFNLPDRPKFNFPDRPKFNLPDRPKFNMPQRPKISMPNFNLSKPRTSSSLRRPLRDRNQYHSSAQTTYGGKKNLFDSLNFRTYPRFFNKKKRIAEENARIRGRAMTPPPRMETDSIPSSPGSSKLPLNQSWVQKYRDIKFVDDENRSNQSDKMSASLKAMSSFDDDAEDDIAEFRDRDFNGATSLDETKRKLKAISATSIQDSEKEQRSSGSSSDRHRKGVLEEIDSDEFFLRQKGLSREDVDVSRYLSLEIRDAFRSPQNALARMDTDPFDDEMCDAEVDLKKLSSAIQETFKNSKPELEDDVEYEHQPDIEPKRPSRSRSLKSKQSNQSRSSMDVGDERENYKTYPPVRPSRKQSMQSMTTDKQSITTADMKDLDLDNESYESNEVDLERISIPNFEKQSFITQSTNETWAHATQPPLPPKRRKSQKSLNRDNESMIDEVCPDDDWLDEINAQLMVPGEVTALQIEPREAPTINIEQATYDSPPIAPLRKSRSRATSLADEDRTSRGCDSLISEARSMPVDEFPVRNAKEDDGNDMFGYATVEKPPIHSKTLERPQRQKRNKPNRPPPPNRFNRKKASTHMMNLKNQSINFFFTYPRRAMKSLHRDQPPVRPVRNYSTIGPSRPPRRTKVFKEPVYAGGDSIPFMDESEKENFDSTSKIQHLDEEEEKPIKEIIDGDAKDLQSGDVIEKMKGRPLPAPPRPPRKSKTEEQLKDSMNIADDEVCDFDDDDDDDEIVVSEKINIQITQTPEVGRSQTDIDIKEVEQNVDNTEQPSQVQEVCTAKEVVLTETEVNKDKTSPGKEVQEKIEVEKKEGPFAAFKEMISQKKREFFEPKKDKETSPTKQESSEQKIKASREKSPIFKFIPLRSGSGQADSQVEEANASTQTDPLPEGYVVEEEQQTTMEENKLVTSSTSASQTSTSKTDSTIQSPIQVQTVIEKRIVVTPDEDTEVSVLKAQKLQVSELDVEKINVSELQAQKISVSNIDGVTMQLSEISSKAGNLVVNGVELPPEFLESLRQSASSQEGQSIQTSSQNDTQPQTSETSDLPSLKIPPGDSSQPPPVVVYPSQTPIIIYPPQINNGSGLVGQQTISVHPAHITPFYGSGYDVPPPIPRTRSPPRDLSADKSSGSLLPVVKKLDDSPAAGDVSDNTCPRPLLPSTEVARPTAAQLTQELMIIGRDSLGDIISQIIAGLNRYFPDGEKRRDAQTAVCIVLVLIAGLMLLGLGGEDKAVHHHHWDFFPPPR